MPCVTYPKKEISHLPKPACSLTKRNNADKHEDYDETVSLQVPVWTSELSGRDMNFN